MKKCYLLCDAPENKMILHMVRQRLEKHGVVTIFGDYDEIEGSDYYGKTIKRIALTWSLNSRFHRTKQVTG